MKLEAMDAKLNEALNLLRQLTVHGLAANDVDDDAAADIPPQTMNTPEDVEKLEEKLQDRNYRKKLVSNVFFSQL